MKARRPYVRGIRRKAANSTGRVRGARPRKSGLLEEVRWRKAPPPQHPYTFALGDRIGDDLTVIGHLTAGRWSELYQVWSATEWCPLTCKVLSARSAGNRTARAAIRRELRVLSKLHHPNVVRVFGGGEHEGLSFLLLEYLEGPSLFEVLEALPERRMAVPDAVRTVIHAGAGVAHLHRSGFLHLDLKPANFLLREGVPVLLDLDTTRALEPARRPRSMLGTLPYMSPEQILRRSLDISADIYGLGAILYELLTGRWPFQDVYDGRVRRRGFERQYPQTGLLPPPSPRGLRPEVTPTLDHAVMRALAREPENRYPSVSDFLLTLSTELKDAVSLWPKRTHPEPQWF